MKRLIVFFTAIIALVAFTCVSCTKDDTPTTPSNDARLIGTWKGTCGSVAVTFEFTADNFVWKNNDVICINSPYRCNEGSSGKYFQWTEGDRTGGDAIFYTIDGNTMKIIGANGTILINLPGTLTKE